MIKGLSKEIEEIILQNDNLSRYLFNLTQEQPPTKRSWLYEDKDPEWILNEWLNHLSVLEKGDSFHVEVFHFDISQTEKWGPQGGHAALDALMKDIVLPTFHDLDPHPTAFSLDTATQEWTEAKYSTLIELRRNLVAGLRPASYKNVIDDMKARDTLESNSGFPDFSRRNLPGVKTAAIQAAKDGSYLKYPAIALFRTYRGKTRLVWMFPMATNLNEATYYQPLQSAVVKSGIDFYAPWVGFEKVRQMITRAYDGGKYILASDFSSTDAHFKWVTTKQVAQILANSFAEKEAQIGLWKSLLHMHQIPLVISDDQIVTGMHGVSSGSNWTNFVETVFDRIFSHFVQEQCGLRGFYAIGDDMAWISDHFNEGFSDDLEQLGKAVGQIVKAEKTTNYPDKVKTLQRLFQRGYRRPDGLLRGVYSTVRALNSSVYPEKFHKASLWSSDMFCARQFMILENCVDHPLFEDFVKFICNGHKDLVPFACKSEAELNKIMRETKLLPGLNPTYNQERRDQGLSAFESIRIARTLK